MQYTIIMILVTLSFLKIRPKMNEIWKFTFCQTLPIAFAEAYFSSDHAQRHNCSHWYVLIFLLC